MENEVKDYLGSKKHRSEMTARDIVVYLSGKYSGDVEENLKTARAKAIRLWEQGYTVLTPHLNTQNFEVDCLCVYDDYIAGDLVLLSRCDVVYMMEGWEESSGAKIERDYAKSRNIPIVYNDLELQQQFESVL